MMIIHQKISLNIILILQEMKVQNILLERIQILQEKKRVSIHINHLVHIGNGSNLQFSQHQFPKWVEKLMKYVHLDEMNKNSL